MEIIDPCYRDALGNLRPASQDKLGKMREGMDEDVKKQKMTTGHTMKFKGDLEDETELRKTKIKDLDDVLGDPALQDMNCPNVVSVRQMLEAEKAWQMLLQGNLENQLRNYAQQALDQTKLLGEAQKRLGTITSLMKNLCKYGQ